MTQSVPNVVLGVLAIAGISLGAILEAWALWDPSGSSQMAYKLVLLAGMIVATVSFVQRKRPVTRPRGWARGGLIAAQINVVMAWLIYVIAAPPEGLGRKHPFGSIVPILPTRLKSYETIYFVWLSATALFAFVSALLLQSRSSGTSAEFAQSRELVTERAAEAKKAPRSTSLLRRRALLTFFVPPLVLLMIGGILDASRDFVYQRIATIFVVTSILWVIAAMLIVAVALVVSGIRSE